LVAVVKGSIGSVSWMMMVVVRKRGLWLVVNVNGIQIEHQWLPTLTRTNIYNEYKPN